MFTGSMLMSGGVGGNDSYTKLLIHANGTGQTFVDSSASNHTITANGDVTQSVTQSKFGGKSAYFDGTGDYLSMADNADFNVGAGNFTIDAWFYVPTVNSNKAIFASQTDLYMGLCFLTTDKMRYFASSTGTSWDLLNGDTGSGIGTIAITANVWHHVAYVRNGDNWLGFIDGVQDINVTVAGTVITKNEAKNVGRWGDGFLFTGYIDEFRFSKGIARWTANFTPPTAPYGS